MKKILSLFYFLILCLNINSVNAKNTLLKVQLQWFDQSQFAGFYVAESRQYFEKEDLDVELIPKSDERDPISILRSGEVDIAISNLNNVFVGEVWFCSGQSNMGWPLYKSENGILEVEQSLHDKIKLFNVRRSMSGIPTKDLDTTNKWTSCNPKTTKNFSGPAHQRHQFHGKKCLLKKEISNFF